MSKQSLLTKANPVFNYCRGISNVAKQTPAEYCLELVRNNDYENFLCTLLLPRGVRSAAFAVRAFNVEVAQVEDQVRDATIGSMRLQFWTDALHGIYADAPPRSPVALELHRILKKHTLSKRYLKRLIDARVDKLSSAFLSLESVEKYAERTVSSIYYLLLEAAGIKSVDADHAASHLGKAHGIVTLIRSVPRNARNRSIALPQDVLMNNGVSTEAVLQMRSSKGLNDSVFQVASLAKRHLDTAILLKRKTTKEANLIFLPIICIEGYLNELRRVDFDVFNARLQRRDNLLPLRLLWQRVFL